MQQHIPAQSKYLSLAATQVPRHASHSSASSSYTTPASMHRSKLVNLDLSNQLQSPPTFPPSQTCLLLPIITNLSNSPWLETHWLFILFSNPYNNRMQVSYLLLLHLVLIFPTQWLISFLISNPYSVWMQVSYLPPLHLIIIPMQ